MIANPIRTSLFRHKAFGREILQHLLRFLEREGDPGCKGFDIQCAPCLEQGRKDSSPELPLGPLEGCLPKEMFASSVRIGELFGQRVPQS